METKHTQGPWIANGGEIMAGSNPLSGSRIPSERVRIASVGASRIAPESVEESAANARLIAAAPALLEACKRLLMHNSTHLPTAAEEQDQVFACDAIAKAEGGAR